jgi:hypothetical protein
VLFTGVGIFSALYSTFTIPFYAVVGAIFLVLGGLLLQEWAKYSEKEK